MTQQQKDQIHTFVEGLVSIEPLKRPELSARMRYQRRLVREVRTFWPDLEPLDIILEVVGPVVGRLHPHLMS